ncbi:MAG: aminopeptidase P N-terminal domain-containing protein [Myxococcota bacterium]
MTRLSDEARRFHAERRRRLLEALPDRSVAVFPAAPTAIRNNDVEHDFRQDSDLYWLTGFSEPEAVALLMRDGDDQRFELVVRPRDPERETWDGRRAGVEGAKEVFGADEAHEVGDLEEALEGALADRGTLVYALGAHEDMDARVLRLLSKFRGRKRKGPTGPDRVLDTSPLVHEMRMFKSAEEVVRMEKAADISIEGHRAAMRAVRPGMSELALMGVLEGAFRQYGSPRNGYASIVAGGANATILHYTENDQIIDDGDLVLIDAGAEYDYYTADITRTFPANGRFTGPQRAVYEVVLKAQLASIEASVSGATMDDVHDVSVRILTEGMVDLGLLEGDVDALIEEEAHKKYYMHRTGHWIGMDVHDVGAYREADGGSRVLEPGMAMTIEPGLYVPEDDEDAPGELRGIGVRIEDDVLITERAPRVLTEACPKAVDDVEALVRGE